MTNVAVLDDWQRIAQGSEDWTELRARAEVTFFHEPFAGPQDLVERLRPFDILMAMRERSAFPAAVTEQLPNLRMFSMTGQRAASSDFVAMRARGITVTVTDGGGTGTATSELALGLMLASVRRIPQADAAMRAGGFQAGVPPGVELAGKTLGLLGLGKLGQKMASYGAVLGMECIAWSPNLTAERAAGHGARSVTKDELMERSDVISVHLVLSERSRGIIGEADLARMKPGALLINTSRGPLVDEAALIEAVHAGRISAALDVYDQEPLPADHALRTAPNTVLTPHLGYVTAATFEDLYRQSIENVLAFLDGKPIRLMPP